MPRVRILHVSDLHFADQPYFVQPFPKVPKPWRDWFRIDSHDPNAAAALIRFAKANAAAGRVDVIVISGDIATTGELVDLNAARDFIDGSQGTRRSQGEDVLTDAGLPLVLIPGNHDRYFSRWRPGNTAFDTVFGSYWSAGQRANGVQRLWDDARGGQPPNLVLVGTDFTLHPRDYGGNPLGIPNAGRFGRGKVYAAQKRRLLRETRAIRQTYPDCTVVWVIHFEPYCNDTFLKLLDEKSLIDAANVCLVPLVLCGHSHRSSLRPVGEAAYSVCGTTTQAHAPDGNHLHVLDIDVDPGRRPKIACHMYRFDPQMPGLGFIAVPA